MYGTQTFFHYVCINEMFENDVKMYGTQTCCFYLRLFLMFENDVKMYGTQTNKRRYLSRVGLRMM